ncbi:unnamed protein product [Meloidogyne enterolobii]|uniref:Uncharacterized protein n=1 Tax=Meloidogyne enterolobii TaxID=390850 RepID=A0ACB1AHV3_MELEN
MLHAQYKRSASMKRKGEIAIVKTRNELESSSNINQQKYSYSNRYNPYKQQKNWKNNDLKTGNAMRKKVTKDLGSKRNTKLIKIVFDKKLNLGPGMSWKTPRKHIKIYY